MYEIKKINMKEIILKVKNEEQYNIINDVINKLKGGNVPYNKLIGCPLGKYDWKRSFRANIIKKLLSVDIVFYGYVGDGKARSNAKYHNICEDYRINVILDGKITTLS
jgi:hypothetical protein